MESSYLQNRAPDTEDAAQLPASAIYAQIERIINSRAFAGSKRLCRFLTWTVEQSLQGEAENIKQYVIGREVFDRGSHFDPRIDSIVRTEAQRLRRKLSDYYQSEGASDPIVISFEPGSYAPVFKRSSGFAKEDAAARAVASIDTRRHRVAVLPFSNLSADREQDYFCYGIADSVQERLASSPALSVISTFSAFRFASGERDLTRISRDLGANTLVMGSVQQLGSRIRIHAKAIDVASGAYIWARVFNRDTQDVFGIQDEIAQAVAKALAEGLETGFGRASAVRPPPEAHRLYVQGRYFWNQLNVEGCEKAADCFLRAISLFPEYAQAYAALVECYHWLIFFEARKPAALTGVTRRLSLQALRLDRRCAEAYVALGCSVAFVGWRWNEAEIFFRRGLELRPSYLPGYLQRGFCRLQTGDLEGSEADTEKALSLDPLSPRSHRAIGVRLYFLRDYPGAIAAFERALELGPKTAHTRYLLGLALLQAGRFAEAITAIRTSFEHFTPAAHLGGLVAAYAADGQRRKANETLQQLHQLSRHSFATPLTFVHAYAGMGRDVEALDWLERAADERCTGMMQMKWDPLLDNLRGEPRFQAVLERMNLV
ncbi:MAG: tetratricopeptide repeat protein [Acidobacteriaceae bacterium]|nr:tetratricopeptide repeat protein [Acidobacteriaceae bacterium]